VGDVQEDFGDDEDVEIVIEQLNEDLDKSNQRVADLEEELMQMRLKFNEQSTQLELQKRQLDATKTPSEEVAAPATSAKSCEHKEKNKKKCRCVLM